MSQNSYYFVVLTLVAMLKIIANNIIMEEGIYSNVNYVLSNRIQSKPCVLCKHSTNKNHFLIPALCNIDRLHLSFSSLGPKGKGERPTQEPEAILFHVTDWDEYWEREQTVEVFYLLHVCFSLDRGLEVRLSEKFHWEPNSSKVCIKKRKIQIRYGGYSYLVIGWVALCHPPKLCGHTRLKQLHLLMERT